VKKTGVSLLSWIPLIDANAMYAYTNVIFLL